jgi:hypothetical protein
VNDRPRTAASEPGGASAGTGSRSGFSPRIAAFRIAGPAYPGRDERGRFHQSGTDPRPRRARRPPRKWLSRPSPYRRDAAVALDQDIGRSGPGSARVRRPCALRAAGPEPVPRTPDLAPNARPPGSGRCRRRTPRGPRHRAARAPRGCPNLPGAQSRSSTRPASSGRAAPGSPPASARPHGRSRWPDPQCALRSPHSARARIPGGSSAVRIDGQQRPIAPERDGLAAADRAGPVPPRARFQSRPSGDPPCGMWTSMSRAAATSRVQNMVSRDGRRRDVPRAVGPSNRMASSGIVGHQHIGRPDSHRHRCDSRKPPPPADPLPDRAAPFQCSRRAGRGRRRRSALHRGRTDDCPLVRRQVDPPAFGPAPPTIGSSISTERRRFPSRP